MGTQFDLKLLAPLAVLAPVLFTATWLVLQRMSEGFVLFGTPIAPYNPIAQPISGLGLGKTATMMNATFVLRGLLLGLGVVGVMACLPALTTPQRSAIGAILLLSPIGTALCGLFTLERILPHALGFLLAMGAPIPGFAALGWLLGSNSLAGLGQLLGAAAGVTLLLLLAWFWSFDPEASGRGEGISGLIQRILVTEELGMFAFLGWLAFALAPA